MPLKERLRGLVCHRELFNSSKDQDGFLTRPARASRFRRVNAFTGQGSTSRGPGPARGRLPRAKAGDTDEPNEQLLRLTGRSVQPGPNKLSVKAELGRSRTVSLPAGQVGHDDGLPETPWIRGRPGEEPRRDRRRPPAQRASKARNLNLTLPPADHDEAR